MLHLPGSFDPLSPPSFSSDGQRVVFTGSRSASVWSSDGSGLLFSTPQESSTESAAPIRLALPDLMSHLACSPDGRTVAAAGSGIRVWSADGSGPLRRLAQHPSGVTSLSFSQDGQWLATSSRDGTALIQRVDGSRALIRLVGQETDLASVSLSPDGSLAVSVGARGSAWVWNVDPDTHAPLAVLSERLLQALWETGLPCLEWTARKEYLNEEPGRGRELQSACAALRDCVVGAGSGALRSSGASRFRECRARLRSLSSAPGAR